MDLADGHVAALEKLQKEHLKIKVRIKTVLEISIHVYHDKYWVYSVRDVYLDSKLENNLESKKKISKDKNSSFFC